MSEASEITRNAAIVMVVAGLASYAARVAYAFQENALLAATSWLFVVTVFATSFVCIHIVQRLAERGQLARPEVWRKRVIIATTTLLLVYFGLASLYHRKAP